MMDQTQTSTYGDFSPGYSSFEQERSDPEPSCVSMKSDWSMNKPITFKSEETCAALSSDEQERSDPEPSYVSMKSDWSMNKPITFKSEETCAALCSVLYKRSDPEPSCVSLKSDWSINNPITFRSEETCPALSSDEERSDPEPSCVTIKSDWSMNKPITFKSEETCAALSSFEQERSDPEPSCVSLKSDWSMNKPITFKIEETCAALRSMHLARPIITQPICDRRKFEQSVNQPQDVSYNSKFAEVFNTFRLNLSEKYQCLCEGTSKQENPTMLNEIYTELYITESETGEINNEHEVKQIETHSSRAAIEDTPIKCNDIFKPLPDQVKVIKTVLTKGVAGIGKTVSVQKFILDWAEGKANQDIYLIFPLPFREINLMKDKKLSLSDLLQVFFPVTKEMEISSDKYKMLFIFDGLDECRLSLDFHHSVRLCDVSESASVEQLLTNIIKGKLLPSALIWITSRPAAADLIPSGCVDRVTEVRGFNEPQKEEYFRKKISDESLARTIISHLKSSRSLYIMCHIPVFCWISATVLERMLNEAESAEFPKTLTQMYTHFLIIQTNIKHQKDYEKKVKDEEMILKLGKLAFEQLVKGNLIFYEEDLRDCCIDVAEASVYSGLCTQIFREEFGLYQGKVYCFVHLSIQEHLAALYVHLSFINSNINVFKKTKLSQRDRFSIPKLYQRAKAKPDLYQRAVDNALESTNGCFYLFLRFLLGLSLEINQDLLQGLITQRGSSSHSNEKTVKYIKQKIRENNSPEKFINLFHCLNELGDHSLVEEIQHYLKSRTLGEAKLSSSQWSAVVFVLLTSEQELNEFNLKKFVRGGNKAETLRVLKKLLPVIQESRSLQLCDCNITDEGFAALTSALGSSPSHLTQLNLSGNKLGDSGVKLLYNLLENPECNLKILRLRNCSITDKCCGALTMALTSNTSHLTQLDMSKNKLGDSGVKLLSAGLCYCKLEKLKLWRCKITYEGCAALTSALRSNPSHLTQLNLSVNNLGDSGLGLLSAVLKNPDCKLEILWLYECNITHFGCAALTSALGSNPSHLTELNLSVNKLEDSGVKLLSAVLKNPDCKLKILLLCNCNITDESCAALTSALGSNPSHLKELKLSGNKLADSGVKLLSVLLKNPDFKLEILWLWSCNITAKGFGALTSALKSNPSHLTELDVSWNSLGDSGVKLLSTVLKDSQCKLEILGLSGCKITDKGCAALASALVSNPSHLTELKLSENKIGGLEMKLLSDLKDDPDNKLEKIFW